MSDYKNKIKVGKNTLYFYECPECGTKRVIDKNGIKAIMLMGSGGIGLLLAIIAVVGALGLPALFLIGMGYKKFEGSEFEEKVSNLLNKIPLIKKLDEQGISMFKCTNCGSGEMLK